MKRAIALFVVISFLGSILGSCAAIPAPVAADLLESTEIIDAVVFPELILTKDKDGNLNVDALKTSQVKELSKEEPSKKKELFSLQVDELVLSIGRVIYKDFTKGDEPFVQVFDVGIENKTYKNITNPEQLSTLILVEAMKPAAIKGAGIYAAAAATGIGLIPAGVAAVFSGKSTTEADFNTTVERAYSTSLETIKKIGEVTQEEVSKGIIKAKVECAGVTVKIYQKEQGVVRIQVAARKFLIPKPGIAGGVLYQITERLK